MTKTAAIALGALVAAALTGGLFWWQLPHEQSVVPSPVAATVAPVAKASAASAAPAILHPVPAVAAPAASAVPGFAESLAELFGREAVPALFRTDDFARRFVATVDNLGRSSAPAGMWPMKPAKGRFDVAETANGAVIQADNSLRYVPYVLLLEQVDMRHAVQTYAQWYPALQREYEQLGFPNRYFNDRFIEVLDQLLATPDGTAPLHVHVPQINGPQPARPWVLYEFDDSALEALTIGQRTLLRMGAVNERRVKVRLTELRRLLADQ